MNPFRRFAAGTLAAAFALSLITGCSVVDRLFPDRTQDYKKAKANSELDVPPDLKPTQANEDLPEGTAKLSDYSGAENASTQDNAAAAAPVNVQFRRDRDRTWLEVEGDPDKVWARAHDFWPENGFLLVRDDAKLGVLETDWKEAPLNAPQGAVRSIINRVWDTVHSAPIRNKFRMRMEQSGTPGTVDLYITEQGIEQSMVGNAEDIQTSQWEPRASDPELEAEMARRMMVYLGMSSEQAQQAVQNAKPQAQQAELLKESKTKAELQVHQDFANSWRSVGIALDRVGFAVEDRNRSAGLYYVKYTDLAASENKKGMLSKLAFWSKDDSTTAKEHQIKLEDQGTDTRVTVLDANGKPEYTETAVRILTMLQEQLK